MTVKELKRAIKNLPDTMEVILQRDPEGNGFSPLDSVDSDAIYWDGDFYSRKYTAHQAGMSEDNWKKVKAEPSSLFLEPRY